MNDEEVIEQLLRNPIFRPLDGKELERLVLASMLKTYAAQELILEEGWEALYVFVLLSGSVRVYHQSQAASGIEIVVKIFKPPAIFGEIEVFANLRVQENVAAMEPSTILRIPSDVFMNRVCTNHEAAIALMRDVSARFCIATANERALAFQDVRMRLANYILGYTYFDGGTQLEQTQDTMAQALGVTRRAIAKEIARWQKLNVIAKTKTGYVVTDMEALRNEAAPHQLGLVYSLEKGIVQTE